MSIQIIDNFSCNVNKPLDERIVATNSVQRLNIKYKYDGLKVYQVDNKITYVYDSILGTWSSEASGIIGTGASGSIPIWNNNNILANSIIFQTGSNIGFGTSDPKGSLQISGGLTQPLIVSKDSNTEIGYNWYKSGLTDKAFDTTKGSTRLSFYDNGSFYLISRKPGDPESTYNDSLIVKNDGKIYLSASASIFPYGVSHLSHSASNSILSLGGNLSVFNGGIGIDTNNPKGKVQINGNGSQPLVISKDSVVSIGYNWYTQSGTDNFFENTIGSGQVRFGSDGSVSIINRNKNTSSYNTSLNVKNIENNLDTSISINTISNLLSVSEASSIYIKNTFTSSNYLGMDIAKKVGTASYPLYNKLNGVVKSTLSDGGVMTLQDSLVTKSYHGINTSTNNAGLHFNSTSSSGLTLAPTLLTVDRNIICSGYFYHYSNNTGNYKYDSATMYWTRVGMVINVTLIMNSYTGYVTTGGLRATICPFPVKISGSTPVGAIGSGVVYTVDNVYSVEVTGVNDSNNLLIKTDDARNGPLRCSFTYMLQ